MNDSNRQLFIRAAHWEQMRADAAAKAPEEACGFVLGKADYSRLVIPVTNILHDAVRFRMDPEEELKAFYLAEKNDWDVLAIYHSHPHGINRPSISDYNELTFPEVIYLIWYQEDDRWHCKGYLMQEQSGTGEVPIVVLTNK
jgi:proteasome lid subunit RPN8/RPN11